MSLPTRIAGPAARRAPVTLAMLLAAALAVSGCAQAATDTATDPARGPAAEAATSAHTPATDTATGFEPATVTRVVDGDTVDVRFDDGSTDRVRFIGVDTPEDTSEREHFGPEATAYTTRALDSARVYLEYDAEARDRYDRLLAYVWLEQPGTVTDERIREAMFNARLLLDGYAQLLTVPPNVAYAEHFVRYQAEAREAQRGLWDPDLAEDISVESGSGSESLGVASAVGWDEAASHEGRAVTVRGPVVGAHYASGSSGQPTFLNLGRDYPDPERLTIVIWGRDRGRFPSAPERMYAGRTLLVTGEVEMYRGAPQIHVADPGAIEVVE